MHVIIPRAALLRMIATCHPFATTKSAMPMLGNVLLSAENGAIAMRATDLYNTAEDGGPALVKRPGSVAIDANRLAWLASTMPGEGVEIRSTPNKGTSIATPNGAMRFTFDAWDAAEFPRAPAPVEGEQGSIPTATLARLIDQTAFSISTDETRPHVNSLFVTFEGATMRTVSTQGHMVAAAEATLPDVGTLARQWMIPRPAVMALRAMISAAPGVEAVGVTVGPVFARFQVRTASLTVRMVDASFPPWQQVVPAKFKCRAEVPREAMIEAVRLISMANDLPSTRLRRWRPITRRGPWLRSSRDAMVRVEVKGGKMTITAESGDGDARIKVKSAGEPMSVGFTADYLLNSLRAMRGQAVTVEGSDPLDAARLSDASGEAFYVIMPARI